MPDTLEAFLQEQGITCAQVVMVGGADTGSKYVVGPEDGAARPPVPMVNALTGVHEAAGVGTVFPDESGRPVLHMHAAFGRGDETRSGCIRAGIVAWVILELIVLEIVGLDAIRVKDHETGFGLLQCDPEV